MRLKQNGDRVAVIGVGSSCATGLELETPFSGEVGDVVDKWGEACCGKISLARAAESSGVFDGSDCSFNPGQLVLRDGLQGLRKALRLIYRP